MCAINPARTATFELKLYTSDSRLTEEQWRHLVCEAIIEAEMMLNRTGRIRAHINEKPVSSENP